MIYVLTNVMRNIRKNIAVYLLMTLETAIGIAVFICCRNITAGANIQLESAKAELANKPIAVTIYFPRNGSPYADPLTNKKRDSLYREFSDEINICIAMQASYWLGIQNEDDSWQEKTCGGGTVFFANNEMYQYLLGIDPQPGIAYADDISTDNYMKTSYYDAINYYLENNLTTFVPDNSKNSIDTISARDGQLYLYSHIPLKLEKQPPASMQLLYDNMIYDSADLYTSECLFLPIEYFDEYKKLVAEKIAIFKDNKEFKPVQISGFIMFLNIKDSNFDSDLISRFITYMNDIDNEWGFEYEITDETAELQRTVEYLNGLTLQLRLAAYAMLAMVVFTTAGVLMIFVNRRRKEMAVRIACGETRVRVATGLFAELFTVTAVGGAAGLAASVIISNLIKTSGGYGLEYTQSFIGQNALLTLAFALFCAAVPVLLAINSVLKLQPAKVLKDE